MTREATCKILELVDDGVIPAREMLQNALCYMSERDVADMLSDYMDDWQLDEEDDEQALRRRQADYEDGSDGR